MKEWFKTLRLRFRVWFGGEVGVLIPDREESESKEPDFRKSIDYHFRCPNCGQAHAMSYNNITVEQSRDHRYLIEATWVDISGVTHRATPMQGGLHAIIQDETDMACGTCSQENKFWKWNDAFYNSFRYFDMDNDSLCHCGGELYLDQIPGTDKYGPVCEDCGWVKPKTEVSGSHGAAPAPILVLAKEDE